MPFCPKCGSEIFEDEVYCNTCGIKYEVRERRKRSSETSSPSGGIHDNVITGGHGGVNIGAPAVSGSLHINNVVCTNDGKRQCSECNTKSSKAREKADFDYYVDELICKFNNDVGNPGWVSARGRFHMELRTAFLESGLDCSDFIGPDSISLRYRIKRVGNRIVRDISDPKAEEKLGGRIIRIKS